MITLDSIDYSLHSIQIKDAAGDALAIGADGSLNVTDNGGSLTVDDGGLTLSIDDGGGSITVDGTVAISGDVNVTQGTSPWVIGDGGGSITVDGSVTVSATDLDIRDLTHVSDSVKIGDGTDFLAINADGSINAQFTEAGYASWKVTKETVTNSAAQLVSTALTGRLRVEIQNLGSSDIYIKQNNTSVLDGIKIPKGSSYEQALDSGAAIYAITASGSSDVRVAEYAA